jgi:curli biogenesis system outer membrane secretion channel CsgG
MKKLSIFLAVVIGVSVAFWFYPESYAAMLKKTLAVSRFENKSSWRGQWALDRGMADQLTEALVQSEKFVVLERQTLGDVLAEQDLAASGRAAKSKTAQKGKIIPVQILVTGAITEFEHSSAGGTGGFKIGKFKLGGKGGAAHVGLIIRLIDTTTGQVLDSQRVEGKAKSGGLGFATTINDVSFGSSGFKKTPLGKATQQAIDKAVALIISKMEGVPFQGKIVSVKGDKIYLNVGGRNGVQSGETFVVYRPGEIIVDSGSGEILGSEEEQIGIVRISQIKEKYSTAIKVQGKEILNGDIVRSK